MVALKQTFLPLSASEEVTVTAVPEVYAVAEEKSRLLVVPPQVGVPVPGSKSTQLRFVAVADTVAVADRDCAEVVAIDIVIVPLTIENEGIASTFEAFPAVSVTVMVQLL